MDAAIRVSALAKHFGTLAVLKGIDCEIGAQEVVCVIGPSGSGKSTFLRCLNGLEEASQGQVWVYGKPVHDRATDLNALRANIGMVFQRFNLFPHLSVLQNIALAPVSVLGLSPATAQARRPGTAGAGRTAGENRCLPESALGWRGAARRDRPRARDAPAHHALR
jgi:polar amino acid transport system ATP-binding protein